MESFIYAEELENGVEVINVGMAHCLFDAEQMRSAGFVNDDKAKIYRIARTKRADAMRRFDEINVTVREEYPARTAFIQRFRAYCQYLDESDGDVGRLRQSVNPSGQEV